MSPNVIEDAIPEITELLKAADIDIMMNAV